MDSITNSSSTIRSLAHTTNPPDPAQPPPSQPSSPRSSALPSPPDSPSSGSVSSLPSVSSSFFFSSAAASPPHSHPPSDHARDSPQGLIIPSLTLPSALRRPTPYGQTLGELRLLVLGNQGTGKSFLSGLLVDDNEDVVDIGAWEETERGALLRASTDWIEYRDGHGLETFEPARNIEIVDLPGYEHGDDARELVQSLLTMIQAPFYTISEILNPQSQPSATLASLLSSPSTPLYTALIFLLPPTLSSLEQFIINSLAPQIPIIVLPRPSTHPRYPPGISQKLSSFRPPSALSLRTGLFRSPETLSTLRYEAADRFLRWREVERTVDEIHSVRRGRQDIYEHHDPPRSDIHPTRHHSRRWSKGKWETEWETGLSRDVAQRLREGTITARHSRTAQARVPSASTSPPAGHAVWLNDTDFDPLHIPSLFVFSLSLFGPLSGRMARSVEDVFGKIQPRVVHVGWALVGGFVVGVGFGLLMRSR